jgi:hypothetical protein
MPNVETEWKSKETSTTFCYTLQLWEFKIHIEKLNIIFVLLLLHSTSTGILARLFFQQLSTFLIMGHFKQQPVSCLDIVCDKHCVMAYKPADIHVNEKHILHLSTK